jgi:hypothetical protein
MKGYYITGILFVLLLLLLANKLNINWNRTYEGFSDKSNQKCDNLEYREGEISNCVNSNLVDCDYDKVKPEICNKDKDIISSIFNSDVNEHIGKFAEAYSNNKMECWYRNPCVSK